MIAILKETRTKGTDRYSSSISSLNLKLEDPWRLLEKILINILKPIYKFNNYNKYFRANDFEKNDKIKTDNSSSISSPNIRMEIPRKSIFFFLVVVLFLQPIANDCERNFIKPTRGMRRTADSKRRQSGDTRPSRGFATMQTSISFPFFRDSSLYPSLLLLSPVISRIRPSVSFFREERRRPGGELWPNVRLDGVKNSLRRRFCRQ